MRKRYIHYGCDTFDPNKFVDISNVSGWNKPSGGLWASPVNAARSWKDWCDSQDFRTDRLETSFEFTLADNAKVLYLNDVIHKNSDETLTVDSQLKKAIKLVETTYTYRNRNQKPEPTDYEMYIDFWRLKNLYNYNAVELTMNGFFYWLLYGWDVDSLLVLNPECIVEVR